MAAADSPSIGLDHPTVNPYPNAATSPSGRSEVCQCHDCDFRVELEGEVPPTCPNCDGALRRVEV